MEAENQPISITPESEYSVPWKPIDNWIGVILLIVVNVGLLVLVARDNNRAFAQNAGLILLQLAYLIPLVIIFLYRRVNVKAIGFGKFDWSMLGMGCGLLIASYMIIIVHNGILALLGINTQGEEVFQMFDALESPVWLVIVGVIFAPLVEEIFFRGFLFQGLRSRYGWVKGGLLSAVIFGAAHLDPVSFIPTAILGLVLAYMYHRTNSVWPGIILHFLVNGFAFCSIIVLSEYADLIPV